MSTEMVGAVATAAAAVVGALVSLFGVARGWREQERLARKGEIERLEKALETRDLWIEDLRESFQQLDEVYRRERALWRKERTTLQEEIDTLRTELEAMKRSSRPGTEGRNE